MTRPGGLLTLTPLGSCRVTNPLRLCGADDGCALNMARVYGYTHSSAEAVQMARFLQKDFEPDPECLPVLMPSHSYGNLRRTEHAPSDLYFVEISSPKLVTVGSVCVQLNYLNRHFYDFFGDRETARNFWSLASRNDRQGLAALLDSSPAYHAYGAQDRQILRNVEMTTASHPDLRRDIAELHERLGSIVVVTHCDARQVDAMPVRGRGEFIAMVTQVCAELGVECYDPTELMTGFGQDRAMKEDGLSTTHFTPEFERALYRTWMEHWIAPAAAVKMARRRGGAATGAEDGPEPLIQDQFSRETILRALKRNRTDPGLNRAMADLLIGDGDHARALQLLSVVEAADGLQPADILKVGQCRLALGQFEDALESAEMYLALEAEAEAGVLLAARSARGTARPGRAIAYWRELYGLGSHRHEACLAIAEIETERENHGEALRWVERLIADDPESAEGHRRRAGLLAVTGAPDARLSSALIGIADLDLPSFFDALDRVIGHDRHLAAASAMCALAERMPMHQRLRSTMQTQTREWTRKGKERAAAGDEFAAAVLFLAAEMLEPGNTLTARALKKIEAGWRREVRAAFREKEFARVVATGDRILALRPHLAEVAVLIGRSHFELEQWDQAFGRLSAAIDCGADGPTPWLFRARSALKSGDFEMAFDSYETLRRFAGEDDARLQREIDLNCTRLPEKAAREALRLVRGGEFDRAWTLARFALRHRPDDPLALKARTAVLRCLEAKIRSDLQERSDDAMDTARVLLEKDPENLVALRILPRLLMRDRRFEQAFDLLKRLKRLDPSEPSLELQLARCERWQRALDRQPPARADRPQQVTN